MLMFGCRHHIADLLVKNVYYAIMKADPSPENQMFKRFRENFRYMDTSGPVAILEVDNKDELVSFYTDMLLKQKKDGSVFHRDGFLLLVSTSSRSSSSVTRTLSGRSASAGRRGKARRPGLSPRRRL